MVQDEAVAEEAAAGPLSKRHKVDAETEDPLPLLLPRASRVKASDRLKVKGQRQVAQLLRSVDSLFASCSPLSVLLTFGPSHSNPKEQYLLRFPANLAGGSSESLVDSAYCIDPSSSSGKAILSKVARRFVRDFINGTNANNNNVEGDDGPPLQTNRDAPEPSASPPHFDFSYMQRMLQGLHRLSLAVLVPLRSSSHDGDAEDSVGDRPPQSHSLPNVTVMPRFKLRESIPDRFLTSTDAACPPVLDAPFAPPDFHKKVFRRKKPILVIDLVPIGSNDDCNYALTAEAACVDARQLEWFQLDAKAKGWK